jgi:hypothetical protein
MSKSKFDSPNAFDLKDVQGTEKTLEFVQRALGMLIEVIGDVEEFTSLPRHQKQLFEKLCQASYAGIDAQTHIKRLKKEFGNG